MLREQLEALKQSSAQAVSQAAAQAVHRQRAAAEAWAAEQFKAERERLEEAHKLKMDVRLAEVLYPAVCIVVDLWNSLSQCLPFRCIWKGILKGFRIACCRHRYTRVVASGAVASRARASRGGRASE